MALSCYKGSYTVGAGTSNEAITGVGFVPQAMVIWTVGAPAAGTVTVDARFGIGFGTRRGGSTQSRCVALIDSDNVATSANAHVWHTTFLTYMSTTTTVLTISLVSFDSDGFTISFSPSGSWAGAILHFLAWGGSDITDANVVEGTWPTAGATFNVTGFGFQPDVVIALHDGAGTGVAAGTATASTARIGIGAASGAAAEWAACMELEGAQTTTGAMNYNAYFSNADLIANLAANANTLDARGGVNTFISDGVTIDNTDAPSADRRIFLLGIKGGQWAAGSKAKATATGNDTYPVTPTFTPKGVLAVTTQATANQTVTSNSVHVIVGGADGTREGAAAIGIQEAINTNADRVHHTDRLLTQLDTASPHAVTAQGDLGSFGSGQFVINWASNTTPASLVGYLVCGDNAIVVAPPASRPVLQAVSRAALR